MEQYKPDVTAQYRTAFEIWSNSSDKESVEKLFETFTGMSLVRILKEMKSVNAKAVRRINT